MSKLVKFVYAKETTGTFQYKEIDADGNVLEIKDSIIGALYIRKNKLPGGKAPKKLTIKLLLPEA
jgi:hypothetical protein